MRIQNYLIGILVVILFATIVVPAFTQTLPSEQEFSGKMSQAAKLRDRYKGQMKYCSDQVSSLSDAIERGDKAKEIEFGYRKAVNCYQSSSDLLDQVADVLYPLYTAILPYMTETAANNSMAAQKKAEKLFKQVEEVRHSLSKVQKKFPTFEVVKIMYDRYTRDQFKNPVSNHRAFFYFK